MNNDLGYGRSAAAHGITIGKDMTAGAQWIVDTCVLQIRLIPQGGRRRISITLQSGPHLADVS